MTPYEITITYEWNGARFLALDWVSAEFGTDAAEVALESFHATHVNCRTLRASAVPIEGE